MSQDLPALLGRHAASCTLPDYSGGSILNLPAEIGHLLGVFDGWEAPPLRAGPRDDALAVRRVVLLVIDGLGWPRLRRYAANDPSWERFVARNCGTVRTLTSVVPATTTVATTALLSNGAAPARSGMLGYSQLLPELGRVANMLYWRTVEELDGPARPLEEFGLSPSAFLPTPSLFETLGRHGLATEAVLPSNILRNPLSRMQLRGVIPRGAADLEDALRKVERLLVDRPDVRLAYVYHPDLDMVSHRHGPEGSAWANTFGRVVGALDSWLAQMAPAARVGTLLMITADHGLVQTPPVKRRRLASLGGVTRLLSRPPGGEARHVYFYARRGASEALLDAARQALSDDFLVLRGPDALDAGLYGDPSSRHPEAERRVGDVVGLALGGATLWSEPPPALMGMHGALDEREMRVPLVAFPLAGSAG